MICITHLPQIAAMADIHFCIEKHVEHERSVTGIRRLEDTESIEEVARMLGGASVTENDRNNAKEMKDLARNTKQYYMKFENLSHTRKDTLYVCPFPMA